METEKTNVEERERKIFIAICSVAISAATLLHTTQRVCVCACGYVCGVCVCVYVAVPYLSDCVSLRCVALFSLSVSAEFLFFTLCTQIRRVCVCLFVCLASC